MNIYIYVCDKYLPETIVNLVLNQRTAICYLRPGEMILQLFPGWWFQPSPLKNHGVSSSVGMIFHSQYDGKVIKAMFPTTNQFC